MSETPARPPLGHVGNPALYGEARRLFPGHPISPQLLADAAVLSGMAPFIPASRETIALGLRQIAAEQRRADVQAQNDRFMAVLPRQHGPPKPKE